MTLDKSIDVSLVIPLYNESPRVPLLKKGLLSFFEANTILKKMEIVLVNDGSSDDTVAKLSEMKEELTHSNHDSIIIRIVDLQQNVGKGGALKAGVHAAVGRWILTLDADMATSPEMLLEWQGKAYLDLFVETTKETTVYIASREHPLSKVLDKSYRRFMGRVFNMFVQFLCSIYENDTQCGFKLYPNHIAKACFGPLRDMGWAHDVEILKRALHLGCNLKSLPIAWESIDISKINPVKDSILMFSALFRCGISFYCSDTLGLRKKSLELRKSAATDSSQSDLVYNRLTAFLFLLVSLVVVLTSCGYGIAANEGAHQEYGKQVVRFFGSLFQERSVLVFPDLFLHGGLFDGAVAFVTGLFSIESEFEIRHLLTAISGIVGVAGAWKLSSHLSGTRAGFWTALLLFLSPVYYGQMFHNPEDIPFAASYIWSVYFAIKVLPFLPGFPKGLAVKLALALGCTMAIWVGGLYLLLTILLIFVLVVGMGGIKNETGEGECASSNWKSMFIGCLFISATSYLIMICSWPWALSNPLARPFEALQAVADSKWLNIVLFQGREMLTEKLPSYYVPHMLSIQMPELVVLLLLAGIAGGVYSLGTGRLQSRIQKTEYGALILAVLLPLIYSAYTGAAVYEGFRNLLFIVPLLVCLAGITLSSLLHKVEGKKGVSVLINGILFVYLAFHMSVMVRLHPYEYIYFNAFAGGLPGASSKFETDYSGVALTEGVYQLVDFIKKDTRNFATTRYSVMLCGPNTAPLVKFPDNISLTVNPAEADFFLSVTRRDCHEMVTGKTILTVERFGVPLAVVKQRK